MIDFFDSLETRDHTLREDSLFAEFRIQLETVLEKAPGWARLLAGCEPHTIKSRANLATLPVLRKSDLQQLQRDDPPFGGFAVGDIGEMGRVFVSPGPIFEPMGVGDDPWRGARALFAAGFRQGDLVHNAFSYHLTPGGFVLDSGARALGCTVFPAGIGNSEAQIDAIAHFRPSGFCGTPDYLKVLLDKAADAGRDCSSIVKALVSGGALFPSLRQEYQDRGIKVRQCYATADAGIIAYESEAMEGMIVDEGVIVEIVRPGTGIPVEEGEVGEIVVTNFNPVYPMIRFGTGDLSAVLPGDSPCGRTNMRIKGWMGRADQTTKIKGMFVHAGQVQKIVDRHDEVAKARIVVSRENEQDVMVLQAETDGNPDGLKAAVAESVASVCKLKAEVELLPTNSLPNDGKVIDDQREY